MDASADADRPASGGPPDAALSEVIAPKSGAADSQPARLRVFINYRHSDTRGTAWAVYRELIDRFGTQNVFFDNGSLRSGDQWLNEIKGHLAETDVFLSLIGPAWLKNLTEHRQRGDKDYVAVEIDLAFQAGKRITVIPVLVDNAEPPDAAQLPLNLKPLPACHVERLRPTHLLDDLVHLANRLEEIRVSRPGQHGQDATPNDRSALHAKYSEGPHATDDRGSTASAPYVEQALSADEPEPITTEAPDTRRQLVPPPDDEHFEMVAEAPDNLVIFLGAGINADDQLPDDVDLAKHLAEQARLSTGPLDLAEIAQSAGTLKGEPRMFKWVRHLLAVEPHPVPVHKYLAHFPKRLEELGLERHYQMIVTTKYDTALERAFREENEPYDVAMYLGPGAPDDQRGKFVHVPWEKGPRVISKPNDYDELPIAFDGELMRTVIVKIHGSVDDAETGFTWKDNYVITEDHYIDYLSGGTIEDLIPAQILAKLKESNCLFLGYAMADWRLRVFLKRIWRGEKLGRALCWAVERDPSALERKLWQDAGVQMFASSLNDYVTGLDRFLEVHRDELVV